MAKLFIIRLHYCLANSKVIFSLLLCYFLSLAMVWCMKLWTVQIASLIFMGHLEALSLSL